MLLFLDPFAGVFAFDLGNNSMLSRQGCSTTVVGPYIRNYNGDVDFHDWKVTGCYPRTRCLEQLSSGVSRPAVSLVSRGKQYSWPPIWLWWMTECFSFLPYILSLWFLHENNTWVSLITSVCLLMLPVSLSSALGYKMKFRRMDASFLPVVSWWASDGAVQQTPPTRRGLNSLQFIGPIWIRAAGRMDVLPEASYCVANRDSHLLTLV